MKNTLVSFVLILAFILVSNRTEFSTIACVSVVIIISSTNGILRDIDNMFNNISIRNINISVDTSFINSTSSSIQNSTRIRLIINNIISSRNRMRTLIINSI